MIFHFGEWQVSTQIPFDYLAIATGTRIAEPGTMRYDDKESSVSYLKNHQEDIKRSKSIVIVDGGAVGVLKANNGLIRDLVPSTPASLINPDNGFILVLSTLQFLDNKYPNLFAVGDIADTGMHKAARPGAAQAAVVAKNIQALIEGRKPEAEFAWSPPAIHLSLGLKYNIKFRNPNPDEGQNEPFIKEDYDGQEYLNVEAMWSRLGVEVDGPSRYHL